MKRLQRKFIKKDDIGVKSLCLKADVGKVDEKNKMFEVFFNKFGHINLMVNNAGIINSLHF